MTSQLPPALSCRSTSRFWLCVFFRFGSLYFDLFLGGKKGNSVCWSGLCEWCLCVYYLEGVTGVLLQDIRNLKLAGLGLEDLMADGLVVMMENIPVLPA